MSLAEFQKQFQEFLTSAFTRDYQNSTAASRLGIKAGHSLSPIESLNIYRDMYELRLRDAIAQDFPMFQKTVGTRRFHNAINSYFQNSPPKDYNLDFESIGFTDHCRRLRRFSSKELCISGYEEALVKVGLVETQAPVQGQPQDLFLSPSVVVLTLTAECLVELDIVAAERISSYPKKLSVVVYKSQKHLGASIWLVTDEGPQNLLRLMSRKVNRLSFALALANNYKNQPTESQLSEIQEFAFQCAARNLFALNRELH